MAIFADAQLLRFKLDTPSTTYLMGVTPGGQLVNCHYGAHISDTATEDYARLGNRPDEAVSTGSPVKECPNALAYEYGTSGCGDYRAPAISLCFAAGHRTVDLRYVGYRQHTCKQAVPEQPAVFCGEGDAATLELLLKDSAAQVEVSLFYCVFAKLDAIVRWATVTNGGAAPIVIEKIMSASLSLPYSGQELLHLPGAWSRERHIERLPLGHSTLSFGSTRGASSHMNNPFAAVVSPNCTERQGEVYAMSLIYSGNFLIEAEADPYDCLRINAGIHPEGFAWSVAPGESFTTPECALVYSREGLGGMSRSYHRLYRKHLCAPAWSTKPKPVVLNNWEATYFDFDATKLTALAKAAAVLKLDLLVMDDGWFGKRDSDTTGLGDWLVNEQKLGCSLAQLTRQVNRAGLQLGVWMEPEMVSEDSSLYRAHPDWCFQVPNREKTPSRNQFVLDLSREDVLDYLKDAVSQVLSSADIRYVKWDFNRCLTDICSAALPPSCCGELPHRYTRNQYRLAAHIAARFPHVIVEGCAGGGGRFDPAQLYYMPHIWTSDNMDSIERMKIQYGTSLVYPPSVMAAHVCSSPNHVTGRLLPLRTRGLCAMMAGEFGYELDITLLSGTEREEILWQVETYHRLEQLVHSGDYYRLADPFCCNYASWMFVNEHKTEFALTFIQTLSEPNGNAHRVLLDGLDPRRLYEDTTTGKRFHGDTLMHAGLVLPVQHADFQALLYHFRAVDA